MNIPDIILNGGLPILDKFIELWDNKELFSKKNSRTRKLIKEWKLSKKWRIRKKQIKKMPSLLSWILAMWICFYMVNVIKKCLKR